MTLFDAQVALDSETGQLVKGAVLEIYAENDTGFTTPLAVTDLNGLRLSTVSTSASGMAQDFHTVEEHLVVTAKSGPHTITLRSVKGTADLAARQAAEQVLAELGGLAPVPGEAGLYSLERGL